MPRGSGSLCRYGLLLVGSREHLQRSSMQWRCGLAALGKRDHGAGEPLQLVRAALFDIDRKRRAHVFGAFEELRHRRTYRSSLSGTPIERPTANTSSNKPRSMTSACGVRRTSPSVSRVNAHVVASGSMPTNFAQSNWVAPAATGAEMPAAASRAAHFLCKRRVGGAQRRERKTARFGVDLDLAQAASIRVDHAAPARTRRCEKAPRPFPALPVRFVP